MFDLLVKKSRVYKNLLVKFELEKNHNDALRARLKDAQKNDYRDERGRYTRNSD